MPLQLQVHADAPPPLTEDCVPSAHKSDTGEVVDAAPLAVPHSPSDGSEQAVLLPPLVPWQVQDHADPGDPPPATTGVFELSKHRPDDGALLTGAPLVPAVPHNPNSGAAQVAVVPPLVPAQVQPHADPGDPPPLTLDGVPGLHKFDGVELVAWPLAEPQTPLTAVERVKVPFVNVVME